MSNITVVSHVAKVKKAVDKAMKQAAIMIGGTVEGHAKELCPVDTGLLRNSITYALGGESPAVTTYTAENGDGNGVYDGTAPEDEDNEITVYVGTNVEYAPYQELGAPNINLPARPYLRPAMEGSQREIMQILEECFRGLD